MLFPPAGGSELDRPPKRQRNARANPRSFTSFVDELAPPHVTPQPAALNSGTGAAIAILSQALSRAGE
jgi:hypothetical protein